MTNNTIPNVPRQLLERAATSIEQRMCIQCEGVPCCMPESLNTLSDIRALLSAPSPAGVDADHVEDVRAMVADPSPAGVDGLEVATFLHTLHMELGQTEQFCSKWKGDPFGVSGVDYSSTYSVTSEPLCRLSDAKAIIDGLRGEVGAQRIKTCTALKERNDAREERDSFQRVGIRAMEERDHLAQCLKFARTTMAVVADNANLRGVEYRSLVTEVKRIDAALSAVCAASPNIAPTSEHSSQPERDPCPMCIKGGICNTPTCGRLLAMPKAY